MREWLKVLRVDSGKSQQDVADAIGITKQYYQLIEAGKRQSSLSSLWPMPIVERGVGELAAEYNIKGDVPAAQTVCENWPGELVFSSYEIGNYCIALKNLRS